MIISTFIQASQRVTEGRISKIWCSPARSSTAWLAEPNHPEKSFAAAAKVVVPLLDAVAMFQFHMGLFVSVSSVTVSQQNMASMNFGHRDIFAFVAQVVNFQNMEANGTNRVKYRLFFVV